MKNTLKIAAITAVTSLSAMTAFAGENSDGRIDAKEAGQETELQPGAVDQTTTGSIEADGRLDAKEAGEDVDLNSEASTNYTQSDEDGRIDAKEAGEEAN